MLRAYSKSEGTGKRTTPRRLRGEWPSVATDYAAALLGRWDQRDRLRVLDADPHPALAWARAGLLVLTGPADGAPALGPGHFAACARGAVAACAALADDGGPTPHAARVAAIDGAALLGERAALLGLRRRGTVSAGGHCRLLRARDGWIAVNLPRPDDRAAVPAWLQYDRRSYAPGARHDDDLWITIADVARIRRTRALVARARLLGLAVAPAADPDGAPPPWYRVAARGTPGAPPGRRPPLVVDLSSLWAGPLATHLLERAGARVVKVESTGRPDAVRTGAPRFFDLLHAGKESVALDLATATGRRALVALLARADVVVESARPRAMRQLGIDPAALVRARPGLTWVGITGHGRRGRAANWIAFGDDAAAAAGLATATARLAGSATPLFCADAIADPLTGMHAAVAALAAYRRGGGLLVSLALRDVAAHALAFGPPTPAAEVRRAGGRAADAWEVVADGDRAHASPPRARAPHATARPFGADTDAVLRELRVG